MSGDAEETDGEIVIRGTNDSTFETIVDGLDRIGINTEVVRREE